MRGELAWYEMMVEQLLIRILARDPLGPGHGSC